MTSLASLCSFYKPFTQKPEEDNYVGQVYRQICRLNQSPSLM